MTIVRAMQLVMAAFFGFASVVEFAHFRQYQGRRPERMAFTLTAAVACGYMGSECLTGDWPDWRRP